MNCKLYLPPLPEGENYLQLIGLYRGKVETGSALYMSQVPPDFKFTGFEFTENLEEADFILIPFGIRQGNEKHANYLDEMRALSKRSGKEVIVFPAGDLVHDFFIDDMIVLKGSQYRYLKRPNEIIIPYFTEDMGQAPLREKSEVPTIGFCGWAGFASFQLQLKYHLRNFLINAKSLLLFKSHLRIHKTGVYWRRRAMRILSHSPRVVTKFIVRSSFSGSTKTIALDPKVARREYFENIDDADFALNPKGDASVPIRFYEILSRGRVPLVVDTQMCFAAEDKINYDDFIIRVPWQEINKLPDIVRAKWDAMSPEQFVEMQKKARDTYRKYLRYDTFFSNLFQDLLRLNSSK